MALSMRAMSRLSQRLAVRGVGGVSAAATFTAAPANPTMLSSRAAPTLTLLAASAPAFVSINNTPVLHFPAAFKSTDSKASKANNNSAAADATAAATSADASAAAAEPTAKPGAKVDKDGKPLKFDAAALAAAEAEAAGRPAGYHLLYEEVFPETLTDATTGKPILSTSVPLVVFENTASMLAHRFTTGFLVTQMAYWSYVVAAITHSGAPASVFMPTVATVSMALVYQIHSAAVRRIVKTMTVSGPTDPIHLNVYTPFGTKTATIPRSNVTGLDERITQSMLQSSKYLPLCVSTSKHPYVLNKKGMFDLTGVLDPILGFSPITLKRLNVPGAASAGAAGASSEATAASPSESAGSEEKK